METWFDIEWYDSNVGWRLAKDHLTRAEVDEWMRKWDGKYQCRVMEVTQTKVQIVWENDHVSEQNHREL